MGRRKILNPKSETVLIRMDRKLRLQLEEQARIQTKETGTKIKLATIARQAIDKFLDENTKREKKNN